MKRLLPVIHLRDLHQAREQVDVALENGADGVWLIHHAAAYDVTGTIAEQVRARYADLWMGVNFLDLFAIEAMDVASSSASPRYDGLWTDSPGITDDGPKKWAHRTWGLKQGRRWPGEYFGSIAFKVGPDIRYPGRAAAAARSLMDVVVTSGPATGIAADLEKVREMRQALGDHRLAVASGITPANVASYLPYVDDYMVATGISRDFHTLEPGKVRALADAIHDGV